MKAPTRVPMAGHDYWRCGSGEHLWNEEEDARCCCNGFSRVMVPKSEAVGKHWGKAPVLGFVFVWIETRKA